MDNETVILKKKCNAQLDKIIELEAVIREMKKEMAELEGKKEIDGIVPDGIIPEVKDKVFYFITSFKKTIECAQAENAFINYSNKSKYSDSYLKIEKETFEHYIGKFSALDMKTFLDYAAGFSFLKSEGKKCVYTSDKIRIYYVNRSALELLEINATQDGDRQTV